MIEPKRLLDDETALSRDERRVLAADIGLRAPAAAKSEVWNSIAAAVGASAVTTSLSSSAAASSTGAVTSASTLTLGAVAKLVLVGAGIGTSLAALGHFGFNNETHERQRIVSRAPQASAPRATASAAAREVASSASLPESTPIRGDNNPVDRGEPNRLAPLEPVEESAQPPALTDDHRTVEFEGSNRNLPESSAAPVASGARDESRLVGSARSALRAGNAAYALQLVESAASRFPLGTLIQEREALRIEALVALGRTAEATTRARAFAAAYPKSPHLGRVMKAISPR